MVRVEERVAFVEGRMGEQSQQVANIREAVVNLEQRMDRRFDAVDRRFDAIDRRFDQADRRFLWLVGLQVTTLIALVGILLR